MGLNRMGRVAALMATGALVFAACSNTGSSSAPATQAASQAPAASQPASAPASAAASAPASAGAALPPPTVTKDLVIGAAFP